MDRHAMKLPDSTTLIFGLLLLTVIVVLDIMLRYFDLPTWPAFMVMIFFFEVHMEPKRATHIVLGGLVGIVCYMLAVQFVDFISPIMGVTTAQLTYVCLAVYVFVAFGESFPMIFNNYAFMFFLVSGLAGTVVGESPEPWLWVGAELVGGALAIIGILFINRLTPLLSRLPQ